VLEGFRDAGWAVTALVATTDTGSSSGVIREQFNLPAPGDIRTVLVTASGLPAEFRPLADLLEYRLQPADDSSLRNMALGNLVLAALAEKAGGFGAAVNEAARLLRCWATVEPVPTSPATLCARLVDGSVVRGELAVRTPGKPQIAELFLEPATAEIDPAAVQALRCADLVVLGPGGLYCSVLPPVLPGPIRSALAASRAKTVYICNITTQPGQTDGFEPADHVRELLRYLDGRLDYVLLNSEAPSAAMVEVYARDEVCFMPVTPQEVERIRALGPIPVVGDFLEEGWQGKRSLHKQDTIRHDPQKVAAALRELVNR
jgi:uncharacterized cofD-like protein